MAVMLLNWQIIHNKKGNWVLKGWRDLSRFITRSFEMAPGLFLSFISD